MQILYTCPICNKSYNTVKEAEDCMNQFNDDKNWQINEFVLIPQKYTYYIPEGKEKWIAFDEPAWPQSTNHFDHRPKFHPWYIIVGKMRDNYHRHRNLVVVYSPIFTYAGWNPCDGNGHYALYRPGKKPTGDTAKNCVIHIPKYTCPKYKYLCEHIKKAVPPTHLLNDSDITSKLNELQKQVKEKPGSIPLL